MARREDWNPVEALEVTVNAVKVVLAEWQEGRIDDRQCILALFQLLGVKN